MRITGISTAAPFTGILSMATCQPLAELTQAYAERCGHMVAIESVGGVDAANRVQAEEDAYNKLIPIQTDTYRSHAVRHRITVRC